MNEQHGRNSTTSSSENMSPADVIASEENGFQPLQRISSLMAGEDTPLDTLADSIKMIVRRDSKRSLYNGNPPSPWTLDSVLHSPMISSPHMMKFPDLAKRRKEQLRKYEQGKVKAKLIQKSKRDRSTSLGQELEEELFIKVHTEDEQWERKRQQKMKQVL